MKESFSIDRNLAARLRLSEKYRTKTSTTNTVSQSSASIDAKPNTIWSDPEIQKTMEFLDPNEKFRYNQVASELFGKKCPENAVFEAARQIQIMIRDGLSISELTDDEIATLISAMGPEEAKNAYGIELKE